ARKYISIVLLLSSVLPAVAQTNVSGAQSSVQHMTQHHLMPVPASVRFNTGRLAITKSFTVGIRGRTDERLQAATARMMRRLEGRTVMEFGRSLATDANAATLVIEAQAPGQAVPSLNEDESYSLEVTEKQASL